MGKRLAPITNPNRLTDYNAKLAVTQLVEDSVTTRKQPSPRKNKYQSRTKGVNFKGGICLWWATLFQANEALPPHKKLTDQSIKLAVLKEFPTLGYESKDKLGPPDETGRETVNYYRNLYNLGRLTSGKVPERKSYRYNEQGKRVNGRTGTRLLKENAETGEWE